MLRIHPNVDVRPDQIEQFARTWNIVRFELFGSVLRDDFSPESDVDVLVTFGPGPRLRLRDFLSMEEELAAMFGRRVDLIERRLVERSPNWVRRKSILSSAKPIYAT